jgi:hypothetical protein
MGTRVLLVVTGVSAWLGGLATALAVSSCDVETCDMDPDDPLCEPVLPVPTGHALGSAELPLVDPAASSVCDKMAHPSVYVLPIRRIGDMVRVVDVDMVWFEHEGRTHEARCVEGDAGCTSWIAGLEIEGEISVSTKYCDTLVSETVYVERTPDDCHVATEYVSLDVSTLGCVVDQPLPDGPPPESPWRLTTPG